MIYLAGPITGTSYDAAVDWRNDFQWLLGPEYRCLSPMRGTEWLKGEQCIPNSYEPRTDRPHVTDRAIVARDYMDVVRAELVVMNFLGAKTASIGTSIEAGWAWAHRVPILGVIEETGNPHDHAMLRELFSWRVDSTEQAAHMVKDIL